MKTLAWINLGLLVVLSVSTGAVKLAQLQADVEIFASIGFSPTMTTAFGVVQALAGLALLPSKTRVAAAWVLAATFVTATVGLFAAGVHPFSVVSLLFIAMAVAVGLGHPKRA